jgi:hypothetical protein
MNRLKFWTRYLAIIALMVATNFIMDKTASLAVSPIDASILASGWIALIGMQFYLLYLRARDVGYVRAGWITACTLIPLVGIGVFLSIAFLPTGSRIGSMAPCLPSTQRRAVQGMRIA